MKKISRKVYHLSLINSPASLLFSCSRSSSNKAEVHSRSIAASDTGVGSGARALLPRSFVVKGSFRSGGPSHCGLW